MITVTTWPVLRTLQARLWGKRWAAASVMTAALLLIFVIPLSAAIGTIVANAGEIVDWANRFTDVKLPPPPEFVEKIPIVGEKTAKLWREYAEKGLEELAENVRPYASRGTGWFVAEVGNFGLVVMQFLLDNVLRPVLIKKGADLPLLLIFAGVIGGLFAFGLLGLFVGPVLLAVGYTLLDAWVSEAPDAEVITATTTQRPVHSPPADAENG